jgi:DNA-binding NarL/FixJ family response regulator
MQFLREWSGVRGVTGGCAKDGSSGAPMAERRRVLVVLGEADIRRAIAVRLAADDFRVDTCTSARDAERLMEGDLALMLVSLELPDVNAVDFVRRLSKTRSMLPVVGLSVRGSDERIIAVIKSGARGCLFVDDLPDRVPEAVREALAGGQPMSRGMGALLLNHVRRSDPPPSARTKAACPLTTRERVVLGQLARGLVYEDIGRTLGVSVNTVRSFIRLIYEKLEVNSRTEAVLVGVRSGFIKMDGSPASER